MHDVERPAQTKPTRVSVALCTYKPGRYFEEQLESIARQTVRPDEIVVTDDSPDDSSTQFVARALERIDIPFTIERNLDRLGIVANFEKAISQCTGDIIFLSDQDDVWVSTKVEKTLDFFVSHPDCLLAHSDGWVTNELLEPAGSLFDAIMFGQKERNEVLYGNALAVYYIGNSCTGAACAFRRALFDSSRPIPIGTVLHDEWLAICAAAADRIGIIDSKLIFYRQHANNVVGAYADRPAYIRRVAKRLLEPGDFFSSCVARSEIILLAATRMRSLALSASAETYAKRRLEFDRFRANLSRNPVARLIAIAGRINDYSEFALGWQSIAVDCILGGTSRAEKQ